MFKPTKKQHVINKAYADKNGGSGGVGTEPLIVNITETQDDASTVYTLDKTWREIDAAYPNVVAVRSYGKHVEKSVPYEVEAASSSSLYGVKLGGFEDTFETNDTDGYPRIVSSGGY